MCTKPVAPTALARSLLNGYISTVACTPSVDRTEVGNNQNELSRSGDGRRGSSMGGTVALLWHAARMMQPPAPPPLDAQADEEKTKYTSGVSTRGQPAGRMLSKRETHKLCALRQQGTDTTARANS